jgi:hypothetical protein
MSPTRLLRPFAILVAPVLFLSGLSGAAHAEGCAWCGPLHFWCPSPCAKYTRTTIFHYKCVCPKPICNPCDMEHYGYYHTCWHPWPFAPDYSHCPAPGGCGAAGPAATAGAPAPALGPMPKADQELPAPREDKAPGLGTPEPTPK